jgi:hypothetical protein
MTVYSTSKFIKAIEKKGLMSERRKQIGLASKQQMIDLIECPLTSDKLKQILIENGRVRPNNTT